MKKPPEGGSLTGAVASLILRQVGARWLDQIEPCVRGQIGKDNFNVLGRLPENGPICLGQALLCPDGRNGPLLGEVAPVHAAIPLA